MAEILDLRPRLPHRVATIIRVTALEHGIEPAELLGDSPAKKFAHARQEAMRACRGLDWVSGRPPSFPQIGRWFNRDHTTVIHACRDMATETQGVLAL